MQYRTRWAAFTFLLLALSTGCKSRSESVRVPDERLASKSPQTFISRFEATELTKCIDENGKSTGILKAIWRLKNSLDQNVNPFIQGFGGKVRSLKGVPLEFQSLIAHEEERINIPSISKLPSFPRGSYSAYKMRFLTEDVNNGISVLKVKGNTIQHDDFATGMLFIPRFALGGEYATRYYWITPDEQVHELSCQAITDNTRARLSTFGIKDGLHDFAGSRGPRVPLLAALAATGTATTEPLSSPDNQNIPLMPSLQLAQISSKDLRPAKRPPMYDKTYKHERIFECQKQGLIDVIWRIADDNGKRLSQDEQFITGFAGELDDKQSGRKFSFNAVNIEPAPAFYSGKMPSQAQFFFPSIEFKEDEIKKNIAFHSQLGLIDMGFISGGGTVFIPRDGTGKSVSVSLSLGTSLRGDPFQASIQCKPVRNNIAIWMNYCLGEENRRNAGSACQP